MIRHNFHGFYFEITGLSAGQYQRFHFIHKFRGRKHISPIFGYKYQVIMEAINVSPLVMSTFYTVNMAFHIHTSFYEYNTLFI